MGKDLNSRAYNNKFKMVSRDDTTFLQKKIVTKTSNVFPRLPKIGGGIIGTVQHKVGTALRDGVRDGPI